MSKLTVEECKQIISKGRKQLTAAEKHIEGLESAIRSMYESFASAAQQVWTEDGMNGLEEPHLNSALMEAEKRMDELGIG